ncbi:AMP-binding protein [Acidisoma sp. L85]|jgi:D-alanine--poly(phosphoribitol) ligase subunit 1|uniref:AMP-binding protein n=1 Tax=Acidisoma sp. L85 TaxID=1641850 RepID=UPI00131A6CB2|nr:AMP-binding protein [Acidisoma sp. L85]
MNVHDVVDSFLLSAQTRPAATAVSDARRDWTYRELEYAVRQFAGLFIRTRIQRVMIALPQCGEAYAAMLGALLAGITYAPFNVSAPAEKLLHIAELFDPDLIVADQACRTSLTHLRPHGYHIDPALVLSMPPLHGRGRCGTTAYVIFTSGSTGTPKGVEISRSALNHYIAWSVSTLCLNSEDRVSQYANIGFDLAVLEIYGALCSGATLCSFETKSDRLVPARRIAQLKLTIWISVPSVVSLMITSGEAIAAFLSSIRLFLFCGEPLLAHQVRAIFAACPYADVRNTYGPTETTVSMTEVRLTPENLALNCRSNVSIGEQIPGMMLHLLGGPTVDEGEIVITGPQLANGYWNNSEQTKLAFRDVEIDGCVERAYFSGDWAERIEGKLYFRERLDFQVKFRGYRIELAAVSAAIRECGWPTACVVKRHETLVALIECPRSAEFDEIQLRKALAGKIESYCIPEIFRTIERLPRNANDKLDAKLSAALIEDLLGEENRNVTRRRSPG